MPSKKNHKILVTGGAGYVGSTLVPMLLDLDFKVTVLDNLNVGSQGILGNFSNPNFEFIRGDVRDFKVVKKAAVGADFIVHLAGIVGYPACRKDPKTSHEVNVIGTKNLCLAADRKTSIIFASTGSTYGKLIAKYCTETTPLRPLSDYGKQKVQAERIVSKHPHFVIYRFATAFGVSPRLRLDLLINDFAFRAVKDKTIIVYEKEFIRTFIHVRDMARSFIHALQNFKTMNGEIYNVGDEDLNFSKEDVARALLKKVDYYLHFADAGKDFDQRNYIVDYSKIRATGFKCKIGLDEGLEELVRVANVIEIKNPYSNV